MTPMLPLFEMAYIHLKVNFKKKIEEDVNEDISATAKKFESLGATYVKNEQK